MLVTYNASDLVYLNKYVIYGISEKKMIERILKKEKDIMNYKITLYVIEYERFLEEKYNLTSAET